MHVYQKPARPVIAPRPGHAGASVLTNAIFCTPPWPPLPFVVGCAITLSSVGEAAGLALSATRGGAGAGAAGGSAGAGSRLMTPASSCSSSGRKGLPIHRKNEDTIAFS